MSDLPTTSSDLDAAPEVSSSVSDVSPLDEALERYLAARGMALPVITTGAKLLEESQEVVDAIAEHDEAHVRAEIGDVAIVLAVIARQYGTTVEACVAEKTNRDVGRGA